MQQSEQLHNAPLTIHNAPRLAFLIREFKRSVARLHRRNMEMECFLRSPPAVAIIRAIVRQELEKEKRC
jgi:hypothetical protein